MPRHYDLKLRGLAWRFVCVVLLLCVVTACSRKHYRRSADKEVAAAIAGKTSLVPNMDTNFTIEAKQTVNLEDLPVFNAAEEFFGADADAEKGARIIPLEKALDLAVKHSRTYQNRKEILYLNALSLTLDRHRFTPIFSSGFQDVGVKVDNIVDEKRLSGRQISSVDLLTRAGTRIGIDFTTDFLRFLRGDPTLTTSSALAGTLTQPLLRGAGYKIAAENLTQAERDLLYALRDFTRFRKEFSVDIASTYYTVLQNRDAVRNNWRGLQNFKKNVERERALVIEGQRAPAQLDQLKQAELTTESRWISALRIYRQNLDQFKIQLGLPVDSKVVLDDRELREMQILPPVLSLREALDLAMTMRLDLEIQRDELIDAERHIEVAANGFLPQLDVVGAARFEGDRSKGFSTPRWRENRWSVGLDLDLPLDRKAERNSYRAAQIAHERAKRELDLAIDNVKLQITDDSRNLEQAGRNYQISELGVQIAKRRVEEQQLRQEIGRGNARDMVDAQRDLIDSENQLTSALVGHTIARLRFWRDIGILFIKDSGQWEEINNETVEE